MGQAKKAYGVVVENGALLRLREKWRLLDGAKRDWKGVGSLHLIGPEKNPATKASFHKSTQVQVTLPTGNYPRDDADVNLRLRMRIGVQHRDHLISIGHPACITYSRNVG